MGLSKLEGGFAVLEPSRWQRYRCVESTGLSCCRIWRYRQRTCDSRLSHSTFITDILRLIQVYSPPSIRIAHPAPSPPPLYLTHHQPAKPYTSLSFCPFHDALAIGHAAGVSCILVPGAGEPNFDSSEADPFEGSKARREREVKSLLDKVLLSLSFPPFGEDHPVRASRSPEFQIQPDMITLDPEFLGKLTSLGKMTEGIDPDTVPFARRPRLVRLRVQGKADVTEDVNEADEITADPADAAVARERDHAERERCKMRGKGKSLKR